MELALDTHARLRAVPKAAPSPEPSADATDADLLNYLADDLTGALGGTAHRPLVTEESLHD